MPQPHIGPGEVFLLLTMTGAQDHLQRHAPQVEGRPRLAQHQLGLG